MAPNPIRQARIARTLRRAAAGATATSSTSYGEQPYNPQPMQCANRVTGVAPLAVHFDAVDRPFPVPPTSVHQAVSGNYNLPTYYWNFADPSSGNWPSGHLVKSRNTAIGCQAAHVFAAAGTYRVLLSMVDESGLRTFDYYQDIVVTDPDVVYAGWTRYVSDATGNDGNNGLTDQTPWKTIGHALAQMFSAGTAGPRRLRVNRGDTFSISTSLNLGSHAGPFTIEAYGTGARPVIATTQSGYGPAFNASSISDLRVVDIEIQGPGSGNAFGTSMGQFCLMLRCRVGAFGQEAIKNEGSTAVENCYSDCETYECNYGFYVGGYGGAPDSIHISLLGCHFTDWVQTAIRIYTTRCVVAGNKFARGEGGEGSGCLKVLGRNAPMKSEIVVVTDNWCDSDAVWILELGPEGNVNQLLENALVEGNLFTCPASGSVSNYVLVFSALTDVRNNIFDLTGSATAGQVMDVRPRGNPSPTPHHVRILNNTLYKGSGTGAALQIAGVIVSTGNTYVANNIVRWPDGTVGAEPTGFAFNQTNLLSTVTGEPVFVDPTALDFRLKAGSVAINAGTAYPDGVQYDYARAARPVGAWDQGAHEKQ